MRIARFVIFVIVVPALASAAVRLASPFGDHMVLQQGRPVPVWGAAAPGEIVTVSFAGQIYSTTTDIRGKWRIELRPLRASFESRIFTVCGSSTKLPIALQDVLVGEVWLCGGQSNMGRLLGPQPGMKPIIEWESAVATAALPQIRQFSVSQHTAATPQTLTDGGWTVCSPATAPHFSAVGFFFAREILYTRGMPVGIIFSVYGGTPAEAWTSQEGLARFPEFVDQLNRIKSALADPQLAHREFLENLDKWYRENDPGSGLNPWSAAGLDTSNWETINLPRQMEDAGHPHWDGVAWLQKTFAPPANWIGRDLILRMSAIAAYDKIWINGVEVGTTTRLGIPRVYHVPAAVIKSTSNEILVRALDFGGPGGFLENPLSFHVAPADSECTSIPLTGSWHARFSAPLSKTSTPPIDYSAELSAGTPTVLFNAMIAPLAPYAIRGVAFYQGESNADRATQYRTLLPALISDWRKVWGEGDFPFLFVQIAPFNSQPPEIREAQLLSWQTTKNTAMIVTVDVGDAADIHPANKEPVGTRLALAARVLAYGEKLEYSGPVYSNFEVHGSDAVLHFTHIASGLVAPGGELQGFTSSGPNGIFYPAQAKLLRDTVVVSSPNVATPAAVRYGWNNVPIGNLFNTAGLPASPFRTDRP